jgi:hypothetical protein
LPQRRQERVSQTMRSSRPETRGDSIVSPIVDLDVLCFHDAK